MGGRGRQGARRPGGNGSSADGVRPAPPVSRRSEGAEAVLLSGLPAPDSAVAAIGRTSRTPSPTGHRPVGAAMRSDPGGVPGRRRVPSALRNATGCRRERLLSPDVLQIRVRRSWSRRMLRRRCSSSPSVRFRGSTAGPEPAGAQVAGDRVAFTGVRADVRALRNNPSTANMDYEASRPDAADVDWARHRRALARAVGPRDRRRAPAGVLRSRQTCCT